MTDRVSEPARGGRGLRSGLLLLVISLLISLALAEVLVRVAGAAGLVDLSPSLDQIPLPEEIEEQVSLEGADAGGPLYIADPSLHHRMAPNWSGVFPEEMMNRVGRSQVPIHTNSRGLRSPEVTQPKPDGLFRILVLGDSVTFGWGVREEDTYPRQLEELLAVLRPDRPFQMINAGVSGYGTWQESQWLRQEGIKLDPDLVIVQVHLNDAADNLWGTYGQVLGGQSWLAQHSELYGLLQRLVQASQANSEGGACDRDWNVGLQRVCWERTAALLGDIRSVAQPLGAPVALLMSPMKWQVEPGVKDPRTWVDEARYQEELAAVARDRGLIVVDPLPAFRLQANTSSQSLFLDVGHPNEAGQRIMAQELYRVLSQEGVWP